MDSNEIIASGLLEMYVLELTGPDETRQVEQWRAQYPDVNDAIAGIEETVQLYVKQYDKNPPEDLKERILAAITQQKNNETPNRVSLQSRWVQYGMVASVALLVGSIALNLIFYSNWKNSEAQVAQLESEKQGLQADAGTIKAKLGQYEGELGILKSPGLKVVALKSVKEGVDARVTVYWDSTAEEIYVNVNNLPQTTEAQQYQLWAIVDGKPVDAGVMELGINTLQKLKGIGRAQTFAITLEKRGGAISPTLEQMIVAGNV